MSDDRVKCKVYECLFEILLLAVTCVTVDAFCLVRIEHTPGSYEISGANTAEYREKAVTLQR